MPSVPAIRPQPKPPRDLRGALLIVVIILLIAGHRFFVLL